MTVYVYARFEKSMFSRVGIHAALTLLSQAGRRSGGPGQKNKPCMFG